jgi:hypothetical protein
MRKKSSSTAVEKQLEARRRAAFEIAKREQERIIKDNEEIVNNENETIINRLQALEKFVAAKEAIIKLTTDYEKEKTNITSEEIKNIESKAADDRIDLAKQTEKTVAAIFDDAKIEKAEKAAQEELVIYDKLYSSLEDRIKKYYAIKGDKAKASQKDEEDLAKQRIQLEKELVQELTNLSFTLFTARVENQKNAIQEQIDLLDAQKSKDIELANQTITNVEQKAAAIAVIEARSAAQKEQLQKRQKELDLQKAKFDKAQAIANIVQRTAIDVMNVAGTPLSPLIPFIIALGATQLASVVAQPIPRYKDGTKDHTGGPAVVGDGGKSELIITPDGKVTKTPSVATLVTMPKHSIVLPDADIAMQYALNSGNKIYSDSSYDHAAAQIKMLETKLDKQSALLQKIADKPTLNLNATNDGMTALWKWSANQLNYLNDNTNW